MSEQNITNPVVTITDDHTTTTSLNVAEVFGKQHKDVLESIRNIEVPKEFSERNFPPAEYSDEQGKPRPMYNITRDGFTILVMGFTGKKAMKFKLAYIDAFNKMEVKLKSEACKRIEGEAPKQLQSNQPTRLTDCVDRFLKFYNVSRRANEKLIDHAELALRLYKDAVKLEMMRANSKDELLKLTMKDLKEDLHSFNKRLVETAHEIYEAGGDACDYLKTVTERKRVEKNLPVKR